MTTIDEAQRRAEGAREIANAYRRQANDLARIARQAEDRAQDLDAEVEALKEGAARPIEVGDVIDLDYQKPGEFPKTYYNRIVTRLDDSILTEAENDGAIRSFLKSRVVGEFVYDAFTGEPIRV